MEVATWRPPKVFISFAHESDEHDSRVLALANRLREYGIDAVTYLTVLFPPEGWALWMEKQIKEADFVLMVCTETYRRRAEGEEEPGKGGGVKWESLLIRNLLHQAGGVNAKFIPVLFDPADAKHIPLRFYDYTHFTIQKPDLSEKGYENLYRVLTNQPPKEVAVGKLVVLNAVPPAKHWPELLARPWNVPPRTPYFTGRDEILNQLREGLLESRVAALSGLGGVGKTQTAIQYAHRHRGDYSATFWGTCRYSRSVGLRRRRYCPASRPAGTSSTRSRCGEDGHGLDDQEPRLAHHLRQRRQI